LINSARFGYQNRNEGYQSFNAQYAGDFPAISGVSHAYPPQMDFGNGYDQLGNASRGFSYDDKTARPEYVVSDTLNWVKGTHTFLFGGEYRAAYVELGLVRLNQREYPQAEAAFQEALKLNPDNYRANLRLLILYHRTRNPKAAEQAERFKRVSEQRAQRVEESLRTIEVKP
jgi:tetratricopeptide (TPR) repeat protein